MGKNNSKIKKKKELTEYIKYIIDEKKDNFNIDEKNNNKTRLFCNSHCLSKFFQKKSYFFAIMEIIIIN